MDKKLKLSGKQIKYRFLDDFKGSLTPEDKKHISKLIREGYVEGEIIRYGYPDYKDHRGYWELVR